MMTHPPISILPMPKKAIASQVVRVLLVEDCQSDVVLVERLLEEVGVACFYEIIDVARLADAFRKIDHEHFDLVMLDLNLLDIDGVAAVAALHSHTDLPIIVYSGIDDARIREKAIICGAVEYLVKGQATGNNFKRIIEAAAA